jgi:hypothetical protein
MHFESSRIYLQCDLCGRQTPGWSIAVQQPPRRR